MRVFVGIKLSSTTILQLESIQNKIINHGRLTKPENLHLTLVFIGEINDTMLPVLISNLNQINEKKFRLKIKKIKMMRDMVIGEVSYHQNLVALQRKITNILVKLGFVIEDRKYYPHITLSRKTNIRLYEDVDLGENVENFSLFLSEFINGQVEYKILHTVNLQ